MRLFVALLLSQQFWLYGQFLPPRNVGPTESYGAQVQRTMQALAAGRAAGRPIRVLFYGQSITLQSWWERVKANLESRFPESQLEIVNRALPGVEAAFLIKNAEADVYPFYPDLMIFHVYGNTNAYEGIIRRVRARTTAEIILQTDHVLKPEEIQEPTSRAAMTPLAVDAWRNYVFLPDLAARYGAELADVRTYWKEYLVDRNLAPANLLSDHVHLNEYGSYLMGELVLPHLRVNPAMTPVTNSVRTYLVGRDVEWHRGALTIPFVGNRVELMVDPQRQSSTAARLRFEIDGKAPSTFPELYFHTRVANHPSGPWPALQEVKAETPQVEENWQLEVLEFNRESRIVRFKVTGNVTGFDGEGTNLSKFRSNSGRVVIAPEEWGFSLYLWSIGTDLPIGTILTWRTFLNGSDGVLLDARPSSNYTIASGLANGPHMLKIAGGPHPAVLGVRVYDPKAMPQPPSDDVHIAMQRTGPETFMLRFSGENRFLVESAPDLNDSWRPASAAVTHLVLHLTGEGAARFFRTRVLD